MTKAGSLRFILLTLLLILLSHGLAVFAHEYAHSFTAWLLGYKHNPLALNYGGGSVSNLLFLSDIDENVNYNFIFAAGHPHAVALIAFAGPGIANGVLFALSFWLLKVKSVQVRPRLFYFLFWLNLMNLGNFYDYVPIRVFATHGDMANLAAGLKISPWWLYVVLGYGVAFLIWQFFTKTMTAAFQHVRLRATRSRASVMIVCVLILFGAFGDSGLVGYDAISYFLSVTSLLAIPGMIIMLWPKSPLEK